MIQPEPFDAVFSLEGRLNVSWPHLRKAHDAAVELHAKLGAVIDDVTGEDASIVVLGSGSLRGNQRGDIDWTCWLGQQT